jgi:hypothetical protein
MTIRTSHPNCEYCKKLWDWGFLDDCFSHHIRVTDLDGFVERNGHLLVLETKSPGASIPIGQQRMIAAMHASGSITIFIIWGQPQRPEQIEVYHPVKGRKVVDPATIDDLKSLVRGWYRYANNEPAPLRQPSSEFRRMATQYRQMSEPAKLPT